MPEYLVDPQIYIGLWPIFVLAFFISWVLAFYGWGRAGYRSVFAVLMAFCILGLVTGQVTGLSRDPAVGAVIPAVLGLIGGVLVYLIGTKEDDVKKLVAFSVIGLSVSLIIGIYWGSKTRVVYEFAIKDPRRILERELALENNRHAVALQKLLNDREYKKWKDELSKE